MSRAAGDIDPGPARLTTPTYGEDDASCAEPTKISWRWGCGTRSINSKGSSPNEASADKKSQKSTLLPVIETNPKTQSSTA
jgi:hypothetical protein